MELDVRLLGVVEARRSGGPLSLGGARQRRLLAHLALRPGTAVSFGSVVDAVWPDGDHPDDPRQAVHTSVSRLRASLGITDSITPRDGGYVLNVAPMNVDVVRFESLVKAAAATADVVERARLLETAIEEWRGNALEGFEHEDWARPHVVRLCELRAEAIDDWAEARMGAGSGSGIVAVLEAAAARNPLRERTHRVLMAALSGDGRQADALRLFQRYRRRLATDVGLEPGDAIVSLEQSIVAGAPTPQPEGNSRPHLDESGDSSVRGFELHEQIGEGSFSEVFRGTQPGVGRDVAVKVIRRELADRPEFIRRFEAEARVVARLEHPYVVPLYDFWREPGRAYLVMRLLGAGTLQDALDAGRYPMAAGCRLVVQIGSALAAAHRAGVVHRDVKPANVFLDREGNHYLGDFGIALETTLDQPGPTSTGTPRFAAPEQLSHLQVGPAADVYGLAATVLQALIGPCDGEASTGSPAVDEVVGRALRRDPDQRYRSVEEFVRAFEAAASTGAMAVPEQQPVEPVTIPVNPYKGLRSFEEADAQDFVGRDHLVERVLDRLRPDDGSGRAVVLVGPSGSGKSSLVHAGVVPAIRRAGVPGSSEWFVTSMFPGARPFDELERALRRVAPAAVGDLADVMRSGPDGIARAVGRVLPPDDRELLVVLDQGEELFTLCDDETTRRAFIDGLVRAFTEPHSRLRLLVTLRADFYDRPLRDATLGPIIERLTMTVPPLDADELEAAIVEPALRQGVRFEVGLVPRITAEVLTQASPLPLLQYALTELFEMRTGNTMTNAAFETQGAMRGALARRAEALAADSGDEMLAATERVFRRLVTPGEGTEDTRRRTRISELGHDSSALDVVEQYGAARLLSFDHDPLTREPTVEVAHEALLRAWPRLQGWIDADRDGLRLHRHLTAAADAWRASGSDSGELYRGARLEAAEAWAESHHSAINDEERAFLEASLRLRATERESARRSATRIRRALVAVAVIALFAVIAGGLAVGQRNRARAAVVVAETQRQAADDATDEARAQTEAKTKLAFQTETGRLAALAPNLAETDLPVSLLVAAEAASREDSPTTWDSLERVLLAAGHTVAAFPGVAARTAFFDGDRLISVDDDSVTVWGLSDGKELLRRELDTPIASIPDGGWNPIGYGGGWLAWMSFGDDDPDWQTTGFDIYAVDLFGEGPVLHTKGHGVGVDPRGRRLITTWIGGEVRSLTLPGLEPEWTVPGDGVTSWAEAIEQLGLPGDGYLENQPGPLIWAPSSFDGDGARLNVPQGGNHIVIDTATGQIVGSSPLLRWDGSNLSYPAPGVTAVPGRFVAASSSLVEQRDAMTGEIIREVPITPLADGDTWVIPVATGRDTALVASRTGFVTEVDFAVGAVVDTFNVGIGRISALAVSDDGSRLAVTGKAGIAVLALDGSGPINTAVPRAPTHLFPSGGPDARWVSSEDNPPITLVPNARTPGRFWRCPTPSTCELADVLGQRSGLITSSQNTRPDVVATRVLQLGGQGAWTFRDAATLQQVGYLEPNGIGQTGLAVAPDLSWYAIARAYPLGIRVVAADGSTIAEVSPEATDDLAQLKLVSSPDGSSILGTDLNAGNSILVDTATWTVSLDPMPKGETVLAAYSKDGNYLATVGISGDLVLRDASTFEVIRTFAGDDQPSHIYAYQLMAFSDDSRFLVTTYEGSGRLWDVATGKAIGAPIPSLPESQPASLPGVQAGVLTMDREWVQIWNLDVTTWRDIACRIAGRNLTAQEWERFGPADEPYHATCSQWPSGAASG